MKHRPLTSTSHAEPARRPRVERAVRREQILHAALELFAIGGYSNTTTAAIAKAVGVTEPILYQHFASKKDILMTVLTETRQKILAHWHSLVDDIESPMEQIRAIGFGWPAIFTTHANAIRLIDNVMAETRDPDIRELLRNNYRQYEDFFSDIFERAKQRGLVRQDVNPQFLAWRIISYGKTVGLIRHIGLRGISIPDFMRSVTEQFMESIRPPASEPPREQP